MARGDTGRERLSRTEQADADIHHMGEALGTGTQSLGTGGRSDSLGLGTVQPRTGQGDGEGDWRLSNWRLRTKLLAVLLIPLLSAVAFGGLHIWDGFAESNTYQRAHEQVRLQNAMNGLVHQLQRERDLSVSRVADGRSADPAALNQTRSAVDQELTGLTGLIDASDPAVSDQFRTEAQNVQSRLSSLRQSVDSTSYPAEGVLRSYTQSITSLLKLNLQGVTGIREPELQRLALATNAIADAQEAASTRAALLNDAIRSGQFRTEQDRELLSADARYESALNYFTAVASPVQAQRYQDTVTGAEVDRANSIAQTALAYDSDNRNLRSLNPQEWDTVADKQVNLVNQVGDELRGQLEQASQQAASNAQQRTILATVATLLALIAALVVAFVVARQLLGSLRTLRHSALDVADRRLPDAVQSILSEAGPGVTHVEPIPVHSNEEIGRVARSFDAVHSQALRLASEQALLRNNVNDLFVNLARRSQTLVQRQLSVIDRLEQDEQDPDQLSSLFELDHLATRMRRNNENLLILGGTDLTRRMVRPVPLTEVVGAAVSEVEQYTRVAVADSPDLAIQGRVVNDFVHLVAELLENATVFSNPDTEVTVRTAYRRQELVLEIRDRGVGIDSAELSEINERLTRPPEIDVAVSRRMGLYVVGQLAQRHDIRVDLRNNGDLEGGVTASVRLSGELVVQLTPDGPRPMPDVQRVSADDRETVDTGSHAGLAAAFGGAASGRDPAQQLPPAEAEPQASLSGAAQFDQFDQPRTGPAPSAPTGKGAIEKVFVSPEWVTEDDDPADQLDSAPIEPSPQAARQEPVERESTRQEPVRREPEPERSETSQPEQPAAEPSTDYSVRLAARNDYGVSDVPRWDTAERPAIRDEPPEQATTEQPAADAWPAEQAAADFDGQCGAPPGLDGVPEHGGLDDETTTFSRVDDAREDLFNSPFEAEKTQQFTRPSADWEPAWQPADPPAPNGAGTEPPPLGMAHQHREADDAPTERLPIYEAVLSQWFREEAAEAPSSGSPETTGSQSLSRDPLGGLANGRSRSRTEPDSSAESDSRAAQPAAGQAEQPVGPDPTAGADALEAPSGFTATQSASADSADPGWGSADVGWQAAEALVEHARGEQETTSAGLPKRVPKSNLVPGSAAPRSQSPSPAKPAAPRSAEAVRGRMSNFQSGVRRGRHAKAEPVSTEPPRRPEEQE